MPPRLRIGTRGSALSLRQTEPVAEAIRGVAPGLEVEIVVVETAGDRAPDVPLERMEGIGFFAKELEAALLDDRCDLAVHSAKDLPTQIHAGLCLAAFPPRTDPRPSGGCAHRHEQRAARGAAPPPPARS